MALHVILAPLLAVLMLSGCSAPAVENATLEKASSITAIDNAIQFKETGDPVDVAGKEADVLSVAQAVRLALGTDPDVQAALGKVRVAEAEAKQSRLLPNPVLTVVFRFPQNRGTPIDIAVTEELLSLLQRPGRIEAADDRLRAAAAEALVAVLDSVAAVQERYAAVQSLAALMTVLSERQKLLDRLLKLAEDRLKQGEGTRLDVTTLRAQRLELDAEVEEKSLERQQERLALARMIGRPSGSLDWRLMPWASLTAIRRNENLWIAAALAQRPEIEAQRWELMALGVDARRRVLQSLRERTLASVLKRRVAGAPVQPAPSRCRCLIGVMKRLQK